MFYGRGAGGAPTASAVVGDVVTEARHIAQGCTGPTIPLYKDLKKAPIEASKAEFAVRFVIHDNPGVLAAIAAKFAEHGVSINGVNQDLKPTLKDPGYDGELQQLRLVTHMTDELTLRETVKDAVFSFIFRLLCWEIACRLFTQSPADYGLEFDSCTLSGIRCYICKEDVTKDDEI